MRHFSTVHVFLLPVLLCTAVSGCGSGTSDDIDIPVTTEAREARTLFLQGRDALDVERRDDAAGLFDRAIAADTAFALAYLYRGLVSETPDEAKYFIDLAKRYAPPVSEGERLLIDMEHAAIQGDLPLRSSLARRLRELYPRGPRALLEAAVVAAENKRTYEARDLLEEAIDLNGLFVPALRAIVNSYLFDEPIDPLEAEHYAQRYVKLHPEEADPHILLGDVYRARAEYEDARGEYTRATILDRESYLAYVKRGHVLTFIGLYDDARKDYAKATELGIGQAKSLAANYRTFTWLYAGDPRTAIEENEAVLHTLPLLGFDESRDFQPYYNTWYHRFRMCLASGAFDDATRALAKCAAFARALAGNIDSPNYYRITESETALLEGHLALARGELTVAWGHTDRSIDFLRPIRSERKRENTELLRGQIALAEKKPAQALEHLSEANQDLIQVKFHRAVALEALGRVAEARELFREVATWDFNNIEYALIRNQATARLGEG